MTPKDYEITFEVAYDDLRGVTHTETLQAEVTVTSNFIREKLIYILIGIIIIAISLVAGVYSAREWAHASSILRVLDFDQIVRPLS